MNDESGSQVERILAGVGYLAEFLREKDWERHVPAMLEALGEAAGVDRTYLFDLHPGPDGRTLTSQTHEWVRGGVSEQIDNPALQDCSVEDVGFSGFIEDLRADRPFVAKIKDLDEPQRALLEMQGIQSIAIVPIFVTGDVVGMVGFDDCEKARTWSEAEMTALRAAGNMFGALRCRDRTEQLSSSLQEALDEVQVLRGIVPICSHCKRIRDEEGRWSVVDVFLRKHAKTDFTHGVCDDCLGDVLSQIDAEA